MYAVNVKNLKKRYSNGLLAVKDVSLRIEEGEIFGLLGPNGAGKTTIIKVLTTLLSPTGGKVSVMGYRRPRQDSEIRNSIGYVPQDVSSDPALTGYENILMSAKLYGLYGADAKRTASGILEMLELERAKDRIVKTYSGGMIRKLEIGQAMVHKPRLLFLDEPTVGLDPRARKQVWSHIRKLKQQTDMTIVVTTHYMDEADSLCDRVAIMNIGNISVTGSPKSLKKSIGQGAIILQIRGTPPKIPNMLQQDDIVTISSAEPERELPGYILQFNRSGCEVLSSKTREITLDDVFLKYAGSSIDDLAQWHATRKMRRTARRLE
jgi:ABC-2 type transport system ATP-binding protein